MKIFMVHEDPWHAGNPYIFTLIEEIKRQHPESVVSWGRDLFWSDEIYTYDIVHFHWPNAFMAGDPHSEKDLLLHIDNMHKKGVKIVATCHDLEPHYNQCSDHAEAMAIVYNHADAIFHLGDYSKSLFEKKYEDAKHFFIPHHLYDTVYRFFPSKEESATYLGLPINKKYILCFGTFRSDEERNLVIRLSRELGDRSIRFLAPGFMDINLPRKSFAGIKQRLWKKYIQFKYGIYCTGRSFAPVSDEDVPYYYGICDIAFIQRVKILNSGNAFMPMLFGKVVVGPDTGNVGMTLKKWGYPVFDVNNLSTVCVAVQKGLDMSRQKLPSNEIQNKQKGVYSTKNIMEKLYSFYCETINN
ncbi:MAG: hypothetical protein K6D97_03565 [Clostridia bacterium]|nr:hypothetical protein [Clostridia bacterium]